MANKIIFAIIAFILALSFFALGSQELDRKVIPAMFILAENPGFDLTPEELTFGKIGINLSASRGVSVSNNFDEPVLVYKESKGGISKNIAVSENNFILNPQESKNLTFSIYTKGLTELREYTGTVTIISKQA